MSDQTIGFYQNGKWEVATRCLECSGLVFDDDTRRVCMCNCLMKFTMNITQTDYAMKMFTLTADEASRNIMAFARNVGKTQTMIESFVGITDS